MNKSLLLSILPGILLFPFSVQGQAGPAIESANRDTVMAFYRAVYNDRNGLEAGNLLGPNFIQHHPDIGDGREGLDAFIQELATTAPQSRREVRRVLTDGDYVIVQGHFIRETGDRGAVTGDIYRLDNNRIVEQWGIVHPITDSPNPDNPNDVFGANSAPYPTPTSPAEERRNLALAVGFYNAALNEKDWEKARGYIGDDYQQHSIYMEDGRDGFEGLVRRIRRDFPNNLGQIKQSFADGDMVVLHLEVTRDKGGLAFTVIELMRLADEKVVEHWDIFQRVTGTSKNGNGLW